MVITKALFILPLPIWAVGRWAGGQWARTHRGCKLKWVGGQVWRVYVAGAKEVDLDLEICISIGLVRCFEFRPHSPLARPVI